MGKVKSIIHVGAHEAEELQSYLLSGINDVIWIEANPAKKEILRAKLAKYPKMRCGFFAAGAENSSMTLNIANNGQSSSLLDFGIHRQEHPNISFTSAIDVPVIRLDDFIDSIGVDRNNYNFINLDIQGYELHALQGAEVQLRHIDFVYTEVNDREVYVGCPLIDDIDRYLETHGFQRIKTEMTVHGWGDALYFKV